MYALLALEYNLLPFLSDFLMNCKLLEIPVKKVRFREENFTSRSINIFSNIRKLHLIELKFL